MKFIYNVLDTVSKYHMHKQFVIIRLPILKSIVSNVDIPHKPWESMNRYSSSHPISERFSS